MTIPVFPTLAGLIWPVKRSPLFNTIEHNAVSGKSTTQSLFAYPKYRYEVGYDILRSDANAEWQTLFSFFVLVKGKASPFHFYDAADNVVIGQQLGVGDGVTTDFLFVRTLGSATDPVQDVRSTGTLKFYLNGVLQSSGVNLLNTSQYATLYGIRFVTPPANGVIVTADFDYYWLCRFNEDEAEFSQFMSVFWELRAIKFTSVKQ